MFPPADSPAKRILPQTGPAHGGSGRSQVCRFFRSNAARFDRKSIAERSDTLPFLARKSFLRIDNAMLCSVPVPQCVRALMRLHYIVVPLRSPGLFLSECQECCWNLGAYDHSLIRRQGNRQALSDT